MGRVLSQHRLKMALGRVPVVAGGSDEPVDPLSVGMAPASVQCSLIPDVSGNNFHGIWACFETGIQIGNPSQYGGRWPQGSQYTANGPGGLFFAGFGPPPPATILPNGGGSMPATYQFPIGSWYFQNDSGNIFWFNGSTWTQKI